MTAAVSNSPADFDLDAKYRVTDGGVLLTGIQALSLIHISEPTRRS